MGSQLVKAIDSDELQKEFTKQLLYDIEALSTMIENDDFEQGIQRIGAEQEVCIVDDFYRPSFNALEILQEIDDAHFTTELGLFNIEANLDPIVLNDNCFSQLEHDLTSLMAKAQKAAAKIKNNKIVLAGILPTFNRSDLVFENMTPHKRYKTLNDILKRIKGNDFKLQIRGVDELILHHESILFEACNTSFQVHLQIGLNEIIDKYNWSQAIAGPILSAMTNAPMLLGKELWSETRIALFQQSIDLRNTSHLLREQKPRVSFGNDWARNSILELFTDDITRYKALVTTEFEGNSMDDLANGIKPKLKALNLHNGTLYKWNRVCYGVAKNVAHLRIENRYIPAGPSIKDEIANALFWVGVMQGMPNDCKNIWEKMDFKDARGNFIKAARTGIDTYFNWFGEGISAKELILTKLITMAKEGLKKSNVSDADSDYYLNIIAERIQKNTTGSKWQVRSSRKLKEEVSSEEANILLTHHLYKNQQKNIPVHEWELASTLCEEEIYSRNKVYKVMTKEVYVVNENDLMLLIEKIMQWKNIHHIPVVNADNKIVGIVSSNNLDKKLSQDAFVKDVMQSNIVTGTPEMTIAEAEELMSLHTIACLPILDNDYLVGIFTKNDLLKIQKNN
ncbi:CBS domain-containing protein [Kordia periserrulae]|uniref:CBS domain-containing protein n=1 Tax=Kordia periserrulae TaxID=701523 RepID=A0A2T6BVL5_9FLAO|nr:CBS domain-containing protein [Kordia periserrulae]PTX60114.1 CBS domain-containing protein [Kordia periserrulae]